MASNWLTKAAFLDRAEQDKNRLHLFQAFKPGSEIAEYLIAGQGKQIDFGFVLEPESLQIGYWLAPELRGQRKSFKWLTTCIDLVKKRGIKQVFAQVEADNRASCRILEKAGFRQMSGLTNARSFVRYFS